MPSSPMAVKSDKPIRPDGCSWAEDHISVGTVERPPSGDAALQGPAHSQGDPGISTANLLEDGHRADAGGGLQNWHNLAIPHPGKRVGTAASTRLLLLRR